MKRNKIFSGKPSVALWKDICSIDNLSTLDNVREALYHLGCKCQELEVRLDGRSEAFANGYEAGKRDGMIKAATLIKSKSQPWAYESIIKEMENV